MLRKLQVSHRVKTGMSRDQVTFKRDERNKRAGAVGPESDLAFGMEQEESGYHPALPLDSCVKALASALL